jgi:TPP-dependent 2-oxoacid decarboxylase
LAWHGGYSSRLAPEKLITIDVDHVRIGNRIFNPVRMGDVFEMLARSVDKNFGYQAPRGQAAAKPGGNAIRSWHSIYMTPYLQKRDKFVSAGELSCKYPHSAYHFVAKSAYDSYDSA